MTTALMLARTPAAPLPLACDEKNGDKAIKRDM